MEKSVANRIKILRSNYNLSVKEFAQKSNLSHVAIFQLEKGKSIKPHKGTLVKIAKAFGTQIDWILYGKGEMLPNGSYPIHEIEMNSESRWQEEAYQELKLKNMLLEREVERLWQLLSQYTNSVKPNYENIRILGR